MRLRMSVVVAVVCLLVPVFSAQADRGRITGVITDTGGAGASRRHRHARWS